MPWSVATKSPPERRAAERRAERHGAYVVRGGFAWPCATLDYTDRGARLQDPTPSAWPDFPVLVDPATRRVHLARVIWRTRDQVGVEFLRSGVFEAPARATSALTALEAALIACRFADPGRRH